MKTLHPKRLITLSILVLLTISLIPESFSQSTEPWIDGITLVNGVDRDNDNYYEEWSFDVNVDALYMGQTARDVYIDVYEPNIMPGGNPVRFGPWDFTGYDTSDNKIVGPFNTQGVSGLPDDLNFTITATNDIGNHDGFYTVPADAPLLKEAPRIESIDIVNTDDHDNNGWFESFSFELNIDPVNGGVSDSVYIDIDGDGGVYTDRLGPFSFSGYSFNDNIIITLTEDLFDSSPRVITFEFTVFNTIGSDFDFRDVKVDGDDYGPIVKSVSIINGVDQDNDNYYETWDFNIDIDDISGNFLENVTLEVIQGGNVLRTSSQHDFDGYSSNDNISIGPFSYADFSQGKGSYTFTINASHSYGTAERDAHVNVDDQIDYSVQPTITSVNLINTKDDNNDGSYEEFTIEIDIDPLNGQLARNVYVDLEADNGSISQTIGPFDIDDTHSSGIYQFGPYTHPQFNYLPREIQFDFTARNAEGSDSESLNLNVDDGSPAGSAPVASFSADKTSGLAPLTVLFTDLSLNNPTSWSWEFAGGNSSTSSQQNPSVVYSNPGTFAVKLTATNSYGSNSSTFAGFITVTSPVLSTDASLSSLEISTGTLQPGFSPTVFNYTVDLPVGTTAAPVITAVANSTSATVVINNPADINSENTSDRIAEIVVTAEDNNTNLSYSITFNKLQQQTGIHSLVFSVNQNPSLQAFAGLEDTINQGENYQLGSQIMATGGTPPYIYTWFAPNQSSLSGNNPSVQPSVNAIYTLLVTDSHGCTAMDQVMVNVQSVTGINQTLENEITLFPNPATENVTIDFNNRIQGKILLQLYDARSVKVLEDEVYMNGPRHELILNNYQSGIYLLRIKVAEVYITKRIIISK